jgi:hypothetical protein
MSNGSAADPPPGGDNAAPPPSITSRIGESFLLVCVDHRPDAVAFALGDLAAGA